MASEANKEEQEGALPPLAAALYAGIFENGKGYMSAAVGGVIISLGMRQMDCGASAFSAFTCSVSLFCALVCFLHALLLGGLDVLEFLAEVVTKDMDVDDRVVRILKGEVSKSILLEVSVAFYLTVTLDNLEGYVIVQRLQFAVMVALSYKAVTIINALAALGLDVLGSTFNNNFILLMVRTITTSIAILLVFENAGLKLTSVITSLGMGGILVAVSSQSLLQDILASLTLVMDKPFEKGDFITAGGRLSGTVESIGLKTTRIRDPHGSLCVLPNRDLCNTSIDNFSHMSFRRHTITMKLSLDTSPDDLDLLTTDLTEVLGSLKDVKLEPGDDPLCIVTGFDEVGICVEMRYRFPASLPALDFMKIKSQVLIRMLRRLRSRGVQLASSQRMQVLSPEEKQ